MNVPLAIGKVTTTDNVTTGNVAANNAAMPQCHATMPRKSKSVGMPRHSCESRDP